MMAEVAVATGRTPRQVYREESVRTMFLTWICAEGGKIRPVQLLLDAVSAGFGRVEEKVGEGVLRGGRAEGLPGAARTAAAAAAASTPPVDGGAAQRAPAAGADASSPDPDRARKEAWWRKIAARREAALRAGARVSGNTVVVHVDDPGAMSAYRGSHPAQEQLARARGLSGLGGARRGAPSGKAGGRRGG